MSPPPTRRVLILGGTGLIGSAMARAFLAEETEVTVVARHRPLGPAFEWLDGARFVAGAAEDPVVLETAVEGVDHVVHAVGAPPPAALVDDPLEHHRQVIPGLVQVLDTVRRRPGVGLTFVSSGGAIYGNPTVLPVPEDHTCHPISAYGVTKLTAEATIDTYTRRHGLRAWVLRVANVYGAQQRPWTGQGAVATFLDAARTGRPITVFGGGTAVRDYVDVSDVATAAVALSARRERHGVVNVGSGQGTSTRELLSVIESVTGHRLAVEWEPERTTDVNAVYLSTERLRELVPWTPVDLETGVRRMWDAWQRAEQDHSVERSA